MPQPTSNNLLNEIDDAMADAERKCGAGCNAVQKESGEAFAELIWSSFTALCAGNVKTAEISIDRSVMMALCLMGDNTEHRRAMIVREIPSGVCMTHVVFSLLHRGVLDGATMSVGEME
jgi:hypothetical protein